MNKNSNATFIRLVLCVLFGWLCTSVVVAQPPRKEATNKEATNVVQKRPVVNASRDAESDLSDEELKDKIRQLSNPSFRTRKSAVWTLERHMDRAIPLLREAGKTTDLNTGTEIVSLLSVQALQPDTRMSVAAHEALLDIAGGQYSVTAVSTMAHSVLDNIALQQELRATLRLRDLGVKLGPLQLVIENATQNNASSDSYIVHITDDFIGTPDDAKLLRYLRSFDTAYLEGTKISKSMMEDILSMPGLERLVLRGPGFDIETLRLLTRLKSIKTLELSYIAIDDSSIDVLLSLPLETQLRVTGTKITAAGRDRLLEGFEGESLYFSRGAFLGIKNAFNDLRVMEVVQGSAAEKGGVQQHDLIRTINDKTLNNFNELREHLATFAGGEEVVLGIERIVMSENGPTTQNIKLKVKLGIQETFVN